jgi:hypothetical protein
MNDLFFREKKDKPFVVLRLPFLDDTHWRIDGFWTIFLKKKRLVGACRRYPE